MGAYLHLELHGAEATSHDYAANRVGSFEDVMASASAARAIGKGVLVGTLVTRSNYRLLAAMSRVVARLGASGWCVDLPSLTRTDLASFDRVVPRLAMAVPFALQAIQAARQLAVPAWLRGAPLCLFGPLDKYALAGERRSHAVVCDNCAVRERCVGVDAQYLTRFGSSELRARSSELADRAAVPITTEFAAPGRPAYVAPRGETSSASSTGVHLPVAR